MRPDARLAVFMHGGDQRERHRNERRGLIEIIHQRDVLEITVGEC